MFSCSSRTECTKEKFVTAPLVSFIPLQQLSNKLFQFYYLSYQQNLESKTKTNEGKKVKVKVLIYFDSMSDSCLELIFYIWSELGANICFYFFYK